MRFYIFYTRVVYFWKKFMLDFFSWKNLTLEKICAYPLFPTPKSLRSIPYMGRKTKIFGAYYIQDIHLEHTFYLHLEHTFINYIYNLLPHALNTTARSTLFTYTYKLHLYLLLPSRSPTTHQNIPPFYSLLHHTFINYTYNSACSSACKFFRSI